ncbi:MAG TPA: methyltransferase [Pirellulales bacterium]|nr:methyltransferase [Pirellulales bacterium]
MPELQPPATDPTPIFELFRGSLATELLTAAITEFDVFGRLAAGAKRFDALASELALAPRAATVLLTALKAMKLLVGRQADGAEMLELTAIARAHLVRGGAFDVSAYVGLAGASPGVQAMIERLRTNRPAGSRNEDQGTAFIFRPGEASLMEQERAARELTLALAGRARNVAPVLAERYPLDGARTLLDVGGGTGIYSIAWLRRHPQLRAVVWDRPEVLKVAGEMAREFGVADRLSCVAGDMLSDPLPVEAEVCLLSNVLHDWDVPECRRLVGRCAAGLPRGGRLLVHDVLLDDDHAGPLPVALYSAALFSVTEGRAYSAAEYRAWLVEAGLTPEPAIETLVHCHVLPGRKL